MERSMENKGEWIKEFAGAVTVCDRNGIIIEMNDKSIATFAEYGGEKLLGTNLLDWHPEPSRTIVADLMESQSTNCYTIEKAGVKKLIYQAPWYKDGAYAGFMEISLEIPFEMKHHVRN